MYHLVTQLETLKFSAQYIDTFHVIHATNNFIFTLKGSSQLLSKIYTVVLPLK
jgi:hypothetical protein